MSARERRRAQRAHLQQSYGEGEQGVTFDQPKRTQGHKPLPKLEAKTDRQREYMAQIRSDQLIFALGPAGAGKTYIPTRMAIEALKNRATRKLILTRPAVEAGEKLGFLPGTMQEKFEPYLRPFRDTLIKAIGANDLECKMKSGSIEALPVGFVRGMTWDDCWVLIDEAQNLTPVEMKMLLTRIGENCKVIISGDASQKDIPGRCGLTDGVYHAAGLPGVSMTTFEKEDVVRSGLVQMLVDRYSKPNPVRALDFRDPPRAPFEAPEVEGDTAGLRRMIG